MYREVELIQLLKEILPRVDKNNMDTFIKVGDINRIWKIIDKYDEFHIYFLKEHDSVKDIKNEGEK